MSLRWYVVHTYSGFEQKAKLALEEKVRQLHKEDVIAEVLVPQESVVEMKKGVKKTSRRKIFPGYILVRMKFDEYTWQVIKSVPKITGFVGGDLNNPPSVSDDEVRKILQQEEEGVSKPKPKIVFEKGESIRVIEGPFSNFNGVVEEVKPDKGKVRVLVSIFGRSTPVELDFMQVEKN